MIKLSKVTSGGRITIPKELRKKYDLTPRRKVKFEIIEDGVKIIPMVTTKEIKAHIGFLGTKGKLLKKLMDERKRVVSVFILLVFVDFVELFFGRN